MNLNAKLEAIRDNLLGEGGSYYDFTPDGQRKKLNDALDTLKAHHEAYGKLLKQAEQHADADDFDFIATLFHKLPKAIDILSRNASEQRMRDAASWLGSDAQK